MTDPSRTYQDQIEEITFLKQRIKELEKSETKRKQSEQALRESEKRYREMIDFLPISFFEVDSAATLISFNRSALKAFRYSEEDFKEGMNALQFFAPEEWQKVEENIHKVIQGTSIPVQEFTLLRKDGSRFIGLIYSSPIIHQNKTIGIRGAIVDITERKQAEEALRESEEKYKSLTENIDRQIRTAVLVMGHTPILILQHHGCWNCWG